MKISRDDLGHLKNNQGASFSLNPLEIGISILVGVATWFGLRFFLYSSIPYPCGLYINGVSIGCDWSQERAWEILGKPLFFTYVIPYVLSLAISGVFLLRSIRRDVRQFSMIANLAFSFPILVFIGMLFYSIFTWLFLLLGLVLAFIATLRLAGNTQDYKWDWVSLAFNLLWSIIFVLFFSQYFYLYGD